MSTAVPLMRPIQIAPSQEFQDLYSQDCQHCGMCCIYFGKFSINVEPETGPQPPKKLVQIGPTKGHGNTWMRVITDPKWEQYTRCIALRGVQGKQISCSIYEQRPRACRAFEPGSDYCLKIRHWAGLQDLK